MIRALLSVRFRALMAAFTQQARQKKKRGKGMAVLFVILYLYVAVVICGAMCLLFSQLAKPYHAAGLDWLYFAMAGLMSLGMAVLGSVFMTQNQLYDARDNDLLLSMPIPPSAILLSRLVPLLALNVLYGGIVLVPAMVIYAIQVGFSLAGVLCQAVSLLAIVLLAQAVSCLLGWLLHLLLSRINKSAASMIYMILFLGIYFAVYSQAGNILNSMAANGAEIARAIQFWVWPLYAMGLGATGEILYFALFMLICVAVFALVYALLSVTFLRSATARRAGKRRRLDLRGVKASSPVEAMIGKELRHFLGSPVYLTNMGIGIIFLVAIAVAGVVFKGKLTAMFGPFIDELAPYFSLAICAILSFSGSMVCISTPSVSLEGKSLWILKSLPVSTKQILLSKLWFHCRMGVPVAALAGLVLALAYGCPIPEILLCGVVSGLVIVLNGVLGLVCGLKWARFDWISEAYPCKQSIAVLVCMFAIMGLPLVFGLLYGFVLAPYLSAAVYLGIVALALVTMCFGFYRLLMGWGVRVWESL